MTLQLLGWYLFGVLLLFVGAALYIHAAHRADDNPANVNAPRFLDDWEADNAAHQLYDQTTEPPTPSERQWSAGDATDVAQALRVGRPTPYPRLRSVPE